MKITCFLKVIILSIKYSNKDQYKRFILYTAESISNKGVILKNILKLYKEYPEIEKVCKSIIKA